MPWTAVRFAGVGVCNTVIDTVLFLMLHDRLGIALANLCSTSAGMVFSFVVNGLFTFRADRLTGRQALLFLATTGTVLWIAQPLLIHAWLWVLDPLLAGGPGGDPRLVAAKLLAIGCCLALNFAAYRFVVWPRRTTSTARGAGARR